MRVFVNQVTTGHKTGVGHYAAELVRALRTLPEGPQVEEYRHTLVFRLRQLWSRAGRAAPPPDSAHKQTRRSAATVAKGFLINQIRPWGQRLLRGYARWAYTSGRYDLYHEPNFIPLPTDLPTVATIHDLSALLHPEWHPPERARHFAKHFAKGLTRCAHLLAVSEAARQEIITALGVAPERVTRAYNGVRPWLRPLPRRGGASNAGATAFAT